MTPEQITQWLGHFAAEHDLTARATRGCWSSIENLLAEGGEDAAILREPGVENLRVRFEMHSLIFEHDAYETPFVSTKIFLYVKDDEDPDFARQLRLGVYDYEINMDGSYRDDWFILYPPVKYED